MIIVEGMDNAGKTTLVSQLSGELRLLTICNRRRPQSLAASWDYLIRAMPLASAMPTIFDRFQPISEPIYGPICRDTRLFTHEERCKQLSFIGKSGMQVLVIYCRPEMKRILDFGDREQMDGVVRYAPQLIAKYDEDMDWLSSYFEHITVVDYDYAQPGVYDALKKRAAEHLEKVYP